LNYGKVASCRFKDFVDAAEQLLAATPCWKIKQPPQKSGWMLTVKSFLQLQSTRRGWNRAVSPLRQLRYAAG
jgi:hypothetical protein